MSGIYPFLFIYLFINFFLYIYQGFFYAGV